MPRWRTWSSSRKIVHWPRWPVPWNVQFGPSSKTNPTPVVLQPDNLEFGRPVSVQGKARLAVNGRVALYKSRNAAMDADRPTLRALPWRSAATFPCLPRGGAIDCARRLAAKRHRNAGSELIRLKDH